MGVGTRRNMSAAAALVLLFTLCAGRPAGAAAQQRRTVKLRLLVKDPQGRGVGGARVNVWHNTGILSSSATRPPDYQVPESSGDGSVELEVHAGKSRSLFVEVNKGDLAKQVTIELTGPVVSQVIELVPISQNLLDVDRAKLISLRFRVEGEAAGPEGEAGPLAGVKILLRYYQGSPRVIYEGVTGPDGQVIIPVIASGYSVEAIKEGYAPGGEAVFTDTFYRGKTVNVPVIRLKRAQTIKVTVEVRNAETKVGVSGAHVVLTGKTGLQLGRYTGATNADGIAEITVADSGWYDLEISGQYFEPHTGEVRILSGEREKDLGPYLLKEKPKKEAAVDSVRVTVLAGDKRNAPIGGASVRLGDKAVTTDDKGLAVLPTAFGEATHVVVTASASGYRSETKSIPVRRGVSYADAWARATIVLQPGEEPVAEDSSIDLVVEVLDKLDDKPVQGARVGFYTVEGALLYDGPTDAQGSKKFQSSRNSLDSDLPMLLRGIKVRVEREGYVAREVVVDEGTLKRRPSSQALLHTVYVERDWTELRAAVAALGARIADFDNDVRLARVKARSPSEFAKQAATAEARAIELGGVLNKKGHVLSDAPGAKASRDAICLRAAELKQRLLQYEAEAAAKERALRQHLDGASRSAANCRAATAAAEIRNGYASAIRLSGEIGALEKRARDANEQLARLGGELRDRLSPSDVEAIVAELTELKRAAEEAASKAAADVQGSKILTRSLAGRRAVLGGEIATLRTKFGIGETGAGAPADVLKRLEEITGLLYRSNNEANASPDEEAMARARASALKVHDLKSEAERALAALRSAGPGCEVAPLDEAFKRIGDIMAGAIAELGAAASLPGKADECAARGACQPLLGDVRALLERDELEAATARISRARTSGCDVSEPEKELEYWRTVRETANLIAASLDSCHFRQALDLGQRIPEGIRARTLVARALEAARRGEQSRQRLAQLREAARREVERVNNAAAAAPFIAQAEQAAAGIPCLVEELESFRQEFKITGLIHTASPTAEEIPADADRAPARPRPKNAIVEEIPGSADAPAVSDSGRRARRGGARPERPAAREDGGTRPVPEIEEIPDEAERAGGGVRPAAPRERERESDDEPADPPRPASPPNHAAHPASAGSLPLTGPWVKDTYRSACCGGETVYTYGSTTATRRDNYKPADGGEKILQWDFDGVPAGALSPGQEIRITVTGQFVTSLAQADLNPPASGGLRIYGDVDIIKQDHAYISKKEKRDGLYILRVRPNAKSVTIELGGDYGLDVFAIYRYGEVGKN